VSEENGRADAQASVTADASAPASPPPIAPPTQQQSAPPEEPQMEIHKPKPAHSWRELLTEIGIVVIGVGIALAAEQTVEWLHWRDRVAEARKAIATETATNISYGIRRMRYAPCLEKRLDDLAHIVDEASRTGSLPAVGDLGDFSNNVWTTGEWNSLMASQTATHFSHDELAAISYIYMNVERANARTLQELEAMTRLSTMVGPGRRLDPASEVQLREALSQARWLNRGVVRASSNIWTVAVEQKMVFSRDDARLIAGALRSPLFPVTRTRFQISSGCPSIGKPMAVDYGQAEWGFVLPDAQDMLKHPPRLRIAD
jgi:hypothetical protein